MSQALAFLKRDYLIAASYRMAFVMQLASIVVGVPLLFFFGRVFQAAPSSMMENYGGDFFAFLLIGVAFLDFHAVSLRTFSQSLRESQLMGTLELVLLSPTALSSVLVNSSLFVYLLTTVRFLLYMVTGVLFGLELKSANAPAAVGVLLLGVVSFASFGIISASVIMVVKRGMGVATAIMTASFFLGGVIFPVTVLPQWLQHLSQLLPITHALRGMRMALLNGASFSEMVPVFLILTLFAAILLPLSLTLFWLAVWRTKITGTLAQDRAKGGADMKSALRWLARQSYRAVLPRRAKNTLAQWLVLDRPDRPLSVIGDFSAAGPVLVLAPHMDDEIIGCGGTLRRHVLANATLAVVFMTDGRRGNPDLYRNPALDAAAIQRAEQQLVDARKEESRRAARHIGIQRLEFLDGPDGALIPDAELVDKLRRILHELKPSLLYVPSMLDTHGDHWATHTVLNAALGPRVENGFRELIVREYEVWSPLVANCVVDIETVIDTKTAALREFTTQLERFDLVHVALGLNSYRSMYPFKGRGHAEAFCEQPLDIYRELYARFTAKR